MHDLSKLLAIWVVGMVFMPAHAVAGTLGDFERDATTQPPAEQQRAPRRDDSCRGAQCERDADRDSDSLSDGVFQVIVDLTADFFRYGTQATLDRTSGTQQLRGILPREVGSPLLPDFRLSGGGQYIASDAEGRDLFVEAGRSLFGVQYRRTLFVEDQASPRLGLSYAHVKYRLSFGNFLELDLGAGQAALHGNARTSGSSFTMPIIWKLGDDWAMQWWQAHSRFNGVSVADHDLSVIYFRHGFAASLGYRDIANPVSSLSGPYLGVSWIH